MYDLAVDISDCVALSLPTCFQMFNRGSYRNAAFGLEPPTGMLEEQAEMP